MFSIIQDESGRLAHFGTGFVTATEPGEVVIYREDITGPEAYRAQIAAALPGWSGRLEDVLIDASGDPVALSPLPTPEAEQQASARRQAAADLLAQIEDSPLAYALITGRDTTVHSDADRLAMCETLIRWLWAANGAPAPNWTLNARSN